AEKVTRLRLLQLHAARARDPDDDRAGEVAPALAPVDDRHSVRRDARGLLQDRSGISYDLGLDLHLPLLRRGEQLVLERGRVWARSHVVLDGRISRKTGPTLSSAASTCSGAPPDASGWKVWSRPSRRTPPASAVVIASMTSCPSTRSGLFAMSSGSISFIAR